MPPTSFCSCTPSPLPVSPWQVAHCLRYNTRPRITEVDGLAKLGVLPVEVHLYELVQVPVEAGIDGVRPVAPEVRVSEAGGEDVLADVEVSEPGVDLDRPRPNLPGLRSNGLSGMTWVRPSTFSPVKKEAACTKKF
jgi:hypothetical protein